jgi:hypothetical protein
LINIQIIENKDTFGNSVLCGEDETRIFIVAFYMQLEDWFVVASLC